MDSIKQVAHVFFIVSNADELTHKLEGGRGRGITEKSSECYFIRLRAFKKGKKRNNIRLSAIMDERQLCL